MRILLFIFLVSLTHAKCMGQGVFRITVYDSQTHTTIDNVRISFSGKDFFTYKQGVLILRNFDSGKITFSHLSYRDTTLIFKNENSREVNLFLRPKTRTLKTAEISSKPYEVFAPESENVFDFEWIDDSLVVLTYEKEQLFRKTGLQGQSLFLGCWLFIISPFGSILDSVPLPDCIFGIYRDPLDQIFILGQQKDFILKIESGNIRIHEIDKNKFDEEIKPLNASTQTHYFFDNYIPEYPEFSHFALAKIPDTTTCIRTISDPFTMKLFRASYKYMSNYDKLRAIRMEQKIGVDKEIIGAYMSGFPQSLYYHPLYAPLFSVGDSVYIFDPYSKNIFIHDREGLAVDSIPIQFLENSSGKFDNRILKDTKNNTFYAVFKRSGVRYLRAISVQTGKAEAPIHLFYKYPEKIKVFEDSVYYLYRKTGSAKTKHLFAERLH